MLLNFSYSNRNLQFLRNQLKIRSQQTRNYVRRFLLPQKYIRSSQPSFNVVLKSTRFVCRNL